MRHIFTYALTVMLVLVSNLYSKETVTLTNATYSVDTVISYPVGPGTQYTELRLLSGNKRLDVFYTTVDATNPDITFENIMSGDSITGCERPSDMAKRNSNDNKTFFTGANGDFYITSGDIGLPIGNNIVKGEFTHTPNANRHSVFYGKDKRVHCGLIKFSGKVTHQTGEFPLAKVNYKRPENGLVLYNTYNGKYTKTDNNGTELRLKLCKDEVLETSCNARVVVLSNNEIGNSKITDDEMILSGHGTASDYLNNILVGDTLTLNLKSTVNGSDIDIESALSGDPHTQMVLNGQVERTNIWVGNNPHTGIGTTFTGDTVVFCVVDGRGVSDGCTSADLGLIMVHLGVYNAVDFDGGGSSTLYVNEFDHMNNNSDGKERAVCNAFFAVSNTPKDTVIARIAPYEKIINVARYTTYKPKFLGYNQYGILVDTLVSDVILSCDENFGTISDDGVFTAIATEKGKIEATYKNCSLSIDVNIVELDGFYIGSDTIIADAVERDVTIKGFFKDKIVDIDASKINIISSNPSICSVANGKIKGHTNALCNLIYEIDDAKDTVVVKVEIPDNNLEVLKELSDNIGYKVKSTSTKWNATWNPKTVSSEANISFDYTGGRAPFVRIERDVEIYSIPDSITMSINSNAAIANMQGIWSFNMCDPIKNNYEGIPIGQDHKLTLYSQEMLDKWDISLFPITLSSFNFNLQGSLMSKDNNYNIYIKDITVHYRDMSVSLPYINAEDNTLIVYPNPVESGESFFVSLESDEIQTISIVDLNGKVVYKSSVLPVNGKAEIKIDNIENGTYFVTSEKGIAKIIINNQ